MDGRVYSFSTDCAWPSLDSCLQNTSVAALPVIVPSSQKVSSAFLKVCYLYASMTKYPSDSLQSDNAQGVVSKPPRTASYGLKYAIIVKANSFYDSGTSYLFALMLLRYVSDLFLRR